MIFYCKVKLSGKVFKNPARYIFLLILKQTLANLVTFSENYLATIDVICHCLHALTFPWQPYIERHDFKLAISLILKSNKSLLVAFFKSLDRFMVLLFVSITLELSRANLDVNDQLIVLWLNLAKKA